MARELMNVTPENVLQARAVIAAEADSFSRYVADHLIGDSHLVGLCGGDPISRDAQDPFNKKIDENALAPAQQYVRVLRKIADQLADIARSFGITEQRIEASLARIASPGNAA
jgi:uncharacterized protein YukE